MSNIDNFIINNGVLEKYIGKDRDVVIPDSVIKIKKFAFSDCQIDSLIIGNNVAEIEENAFYIFSQVESVTINSPDIKISSKAFFCHPGKYILPKDFLATSNNRSKDFFPFIKDLSIREIAHIWIYQSDAWLSSAQRSECDVDQLAKEIISVIKEAEKITGKMQTRIADFLDLNSSKISSGEAKAICDAVREKDEKIYKKLITAEGVRMALSDEKIMIEEPIEAYAISLLEKRPLHPKAIAFTKGLPYAGKTTLCTPRLLNILTSEYLYLFDEYKIDNNGHTQLKLPENMKIHDLVPKEADVIAAALDADALSEALGKLAFAYNSYLPWMYAYARFATEESIKRLQIRYEVDNLAEALLLSNKKAAADNLQYCGYRHLKRYAYIHDMPEEEFESRKRILCRYYEKKGEIGRCAAIYNISVSEYRDRFSVPDFGFDNNGVKRYTVNGIALEVRIANNFKLYIQEVQTGKIIKSISKKTEDGVKAAEDYAITKKGVDEFYKKRIGYVKEIYINAEEISESIWRDIYMSNPLFRPIVESLIWQDSNNCFFEVTTGVCKDINGNKFEPNGKIKVAHVLDMTSKQIEEWQNHLIATQKTLLIEQVWEPVVDISSIDDISTRYIGAVLTKTERNTLKKNLKDKAINVYSSFAEAEYDYIAQKRVYETSGSMVIGGYNVLNYEVDQETGDITLGKIKISKSKGLYRALNTIIFELDRSTLKAAIARDDVNTLMSVGLEILTVAQVSDFINFAIQCNSTSCVACLMNYKNDKLGYDGAFDMFVLD